MMPAIVRALLLASILLYININRHSVADSGLNIQTGKFGMGGVSRCNPN